MITGSKMTVNRMGSKRTRITKRQAMTPAPLRNVTAMDADVGAAGALAGASAAMIQSRALLPVISPMSRRMRG